MPKSLFDYKSAYKLSLTFFSVVSIVAILVAGGTFIYFTAKINKMSQEIYVMNKSGDVEVATKENLNAEGRMYEYEDHVKTFYRLWYSFDQYTFLERINAALKLIGDEGQKMLNDYKAVHVAERLVQYNMSLEVKITKVVIDMQKTPVEGYIEGIQTNFQGGGQSSRNMFCKFSLRDLTARSRENPHGVLIISWEVYNNQRINNDNDKE